MYVFTVNSYYLFNWNWNQFTIDDNKDISNKNVFGGRKINNFYKTNRKQVKPKNIQTVHTTHTFLYIGLRTMHTFAIAINAPSCTLVTFDPEPTLDWTTRKH